MAAQTDIDLEEAPPEQQDAPRQPPIINSSIGANPIISSAPSDASPAVQPSTDTPAQFQKPAPVQPVAPGPLTPPGRVAPRPPLPVYPTRQENIVARQFRAQQDYSDNVSRFNNSTAYVQQQAQLRAQQAQDAQRRADQATTYQGQEQEKAVVNTEQRNLLKSQGVETQVNPDTGIVEPTRDEKGAIQFRANMSPEDKQLALDTQLHEAGKNAMGQNVYEAARNIRNTIQDVTANGARLAQLQQNLTDFDKNNPGINETQPGGGWLGSQFRAGPTDTAIALRKQKSDLQKEIADLTKKGYPAIPDYGDVSTALKSLSPDTEVGSTYMSARERHAAATAEREAWTKVAPKDGGDIDQLIMDRTNDVLAAGKDPTKDGVLNAIKDRRAELGIPEPSPEEQALKADPVFGPAIAKAREQMTNGQAQMAPLQTRANKLLSRLESVVGFQTNPVTADQGDPDARLGLLRAFTDHITDPAQKGKVNTLLTALAPTLAQLRQSKAALQSVVNAHDALQDQWKKKYAADNAPEAEAQPPGATAPAGPAGPGATPGAGPAPQQPTAGPVSPQDFETKLSPQDEAKFQDWKAKNAPNDSGNDYDLRGAFKAGVTPDAQTGHWPDTFKKPNHPTFSDQSVYAKDRPDLAGHWEGDKFAPPTTATADTTPNHKGETPIAAYLKSGKIVYPSELKPDVVHAVFSNFLQKAIGSLGTIIQGAAGLAVQHPNLPNDSSSTEKMDWLKKSPDPLLQWARQAPETGKRLFPVNPEHTENFAVKAAGEAGGFVAPLVTGPFAPFTMAMQSAGEHITSDYDELLKTGMSPRAAAEETFKRATASGLTSEVVWSVLPPVLRTVGDKYLIDKFGAEGVKRFLLGRIAQAGEGAVLGATTRIGENTASGDKLFKGVGESTAGMAGLQLLFPRGKTPLEEKRARNVADAESRATTRVTTKTTPEAAPTENLHDIQYSSPETKAWLEQKDKLQSVYDATEPHTPERKAARAALREHDDQNPGGYKYDASDPLAMVNNTSHPSDTIGQTNLRGAIWAGDWFKDDETGRTVRKVKTADGDTRYVDQGSLRPHEGVALDKNSTATAKPTPEAAHAEIDGLQPSEKVAPEQIEQTRHALRGLVKIAGGQPLAALTTAERLALFKSPTPDGGRRVEMIRGEDGKQKPVISDATLARVRDISPTTAQLLPEDEASQRQAVLAPNEASTAEPGTGKQIDLAGMGKGVTDNLYDTLWNKLQKSDLSEGGKPSGLLQRARDEMQAGTITNQQELRDWAQSGGQLSPVAKRVKVLSKTLQINGVDTQTAAAFASKFVGDRGTDEEAYAQRTAVKEAFTSAGGKFTETGERDPTVDQANQALREKIQRVEPEAGAYGKGSGKKETGAVSKPGGAPVDGETRGVGATGENRESAFTRESAQTAEQTATKPELAGRTHVDDSIDAAFEQRKADFRRAGIQQITETNEPFGATGVRERADGSRELLVNRKVAREWFDKFGPDKARELINKGFEEEAKHAIERKVARDNGTDTAALYRDWAKKNPDQEKILANAYGKEWANYSDTGKSAELARMILQSRANGKTTEQLHLGPERAAAVDRALKQFKEPVRLTERLRQHLSNVLEYLRGIKNPSKAILDHIREVERFENELQTSGESGTVAMARPDDVNSARDREQASIDGTKPPPQRLKDAMPLAERIAAGYRNIPGVDAKDAAQHARIALARASKAFDSSRGVPFETFARVAINNELRGLYRKQSKIPEKTTLDEPLSGETSETRASQLPDEAGRSPADEAAHNEGVRALHEAIDALPAKMRTVMTRLAAGDDAGAIARDLDIAKQGVSNLKIAALRRLRGKLGEHGITGIDDDGIVRMAKPEPKEIPVPTGETPEEKRTFRRAATRLVPGLNVAKNVKTGIQSLLLPTAQSPEHVRAAVDLGRPLGEMHHRQEVSAFQLKPDWKAFEKMGVHREDVPLTENAGIKFMSDMSQGRKMEPAMQSVADRIDAMFIERLDHLEKAGAPIESVRENYFPGMWTRESREAFNQAMGEFREAGKLPDDFDVNDAPAALKIAIKARADELLENGQGSAKDMLSYLVRTPMKGKESFRKGKVFDDIMTAVEFGLRPISNNPADLVMGKLAEMDKSIMANQAFRTWEKKGQLVAFDNSGRPMKQELRRGFNRDEWTQINDKYGTIWHRNEETGMLEKIGERWATKPVADIVNNYLSSSLYNNRYVGKLYTGWMATANALNQSQLGWGSAFHAGFTTMEAQVSAGANLLKDVYSVMRGTRSFGDLARTAKEYPTAFAKTAMTGDKVLNAWRDPDGVIDPRIAQVVRATELAGAGFKLERGMKTEQTARVVSDWFSGNKVRAAMRSPIAFTELLAKPIMEQLVPRQKAGVFAHLAWRIIEQNPGNAIEDLAPEFRDAWNRVDARLGQVRYDRLFANNTAKNVVQALVRAPGWTGGTIAELGGAFKDAGTFVKDWHRTGSLPKNIPDRVAYSLSLLVTAAAMNGALTYALTGTAPQGKDFLAFRDGGVDEAGNPTRMILPSYMKDVWAYATHPMDTLLHKSHPLLSIFGDLIQNKDYYGVQVRDPEANALTQALQSGLHVVKAFTPFWIRGVLQAKTPTAKALPLIGVMPAPKSMTATPAQELAYELHKRQYEGLTKTHAEAEKTKLHSELIKSARSGDTVSVRQAVVDGKITRSEAQRLLSDARLTPFQSTVHKLPLEQALRVFDKGTQSEKEELRPVLQKKNEDAHKRGDISAEKYLDYKTKLAGSTTPQAARPVLHTKPVMPRPQPDLTAGRKKVSGVNLIRQWKQAA